MDVVFCLFTPWMLVDALRPWGLAPSVESPTETMIFFRKHIHENTPSQKASTTQFSHIYDKPNHRADRHSLVTTISHNP